MTKYACPCCGYRTLHEPPPGTFDICPVCLWEDDNVQHDDPDFRGGANDVSLNEARANFRRMRVSDAQFADRDRAPLPDEEPGTPP